MCFKIVKSVILLKKGMFLFSLVVDIAVATHLLESKQWPPNSCRPDNYARNYASREILLLVNWRQDM